MSASEAFALLLAVATVALAVALPWLVRHRPEVESMTAWRRAMVALDLASGRVTR